MTAWVLRVAGELDGRGLDALPYGVFVTADDPDPRLGVRIGQLVLDLRGVAEQLLPNHPDVLSASSLDPLLAAGPPVWTAARAAVVEALTDSAYEAAVAPFLVPESQVSLRLAFSVADYVDFYSSEQHAANVGAIFRPDQPDLPAAWRRLPIGYHGRSGTVVVTGTDVVRPAGWLREQDGQVSFGPCRRLDLEAEVGFVVGVPSASPVPVHAFADHVFGVVLLNDWSARDIQAFEYVPLGPFLGKSFATSISGWVLPLAALESARVAPPARVPPAQGPLDDSEEPLGGFDLALEVLINDTVVSRPPFASMYWTPAQQLAHLTSNGASLRTGDLLGSGTVSGPDPGHWGSLLELSWGGTREVPLADGTSRTFLRDDDVVLLRGEARSAGGGRVTLGEVRGRVVATAAQGPV